MKIKYRLVHNFEKVYGRYSVTKQFGNNEAGFVSWIRVTHKLKELAGGLISCLSLRIYSGTYNLSTDFWVNFFGETECWIRKSGLRLQSELDVLTPSKSTYFIGLSLKIENKLQK